jgi:hypothetical protein
VKNINAMVMYMGGEDTAVHESCVGWAWSDLIVPSCHCLSHSAKIVPVWVPIRPNGRSIAEFVTIEVQFLSLCLPSPQWKWVPIVDPYVEVVIQVED